MVEDNRFRDIFIRLEKIKEIVDLLKEIEEKNNYIKTLFTHYEGLKIEENKIFESWASSIEEINEKINHIII